MEIKNNTWRFIHHLSYPVTYDEIEISNMLDRGIVATIYNNFEYLDLILSSDVLFIASDGAISNKNKFIEWRKQVGRVRKMHYLNCIIKINNETSATVFFTRYVQLMNFKEISHDRYFELTKYSDGWKITKSGPR